MQKLLEKDKKLRIKNLRTEINYIILKSIFKNLNFFTLIRWNAFIKLQNLSSNNKYAIINRCVFSVNKKRFNKLTNFSRHIFLKLIRNGQIHGIKKSSW
jgi:ribosomal protein S14